MAEAKAGDKVRVHYTGTLDDGQVFDSSRGRDPIEFELGSGQVIAGFNEAVTGMEPGESRRVTIPSAQAYGPHVPENVVTVERKQLPEDIEPQVGQQLQMSQGEQNFRVTVTRVTEEAVELDANHPLAGRDLTFDLELVEIV